MEPDPPSNFPDPPVVEILPPCILNTEDLEVPFNDLFATEVMERPVSENASESAPEAVSTLPVSENASDSAQEAMKLPMSENASVSAPEAMKLSESENISESELYKVVMQSIPRTVGPDKGKAPIEIAINPSLNILESDEKDIVINVGGEVFEKGSSSERSRKRKLTELDFLKPHGQVILLLVKQNILHTKSTPKCLKSFHTHQSKVFVQNKFNERLVGILHETRSKKIVVLCHDFPSTKEGKIVLDLACQLEMDGISSFRFDFSGIGESEGSHASGNFTKEVDDLDAVVNLLKKTSRVVAAIVGHGRGGVIVLMYGSKYHGASVGINIAGRCDMKKGVAERLGEAVMDRLKKNGLIPEKGEPYWPPSRGSMIERLNTDMYAVCETMSADFRVLTVHGSADEDVPVEDAYRFARIIPNHFLHVIEGADHLFSQHLDELISVVIFFIKKCMKDD